MRIALLAPPMRFGHRSGAEWVHMYFHTRAGFPPNPGAGSHGRQRWKQLMGQRWELVERQRWKVTVVLRDKKRAVTPGNWGHRPIITRSE